MTVNRGKIRTTDDCNTPKSILYLLLLIIILFVIFETRFHYIAQAGLEILSTSETPEPWTTGLSYSSQCFLHYRNPYPHDSFLSPVSAAWPFLGLKV